MPGTVAQARPSLYGSTLFGEEINIKKIERPDGSTETIDPISITHKGVAVKTSFFKAVFSADGSRHLEGPALLKDGFKTQSSFGMFKTDDAMGIRLTSEKPRRGKLLVDVKGDNIDYRLLESPNVILTNNGELGRLSKPYIKIASRELIENLGGELGNEIKVGYKDAGTIHQEAQRLKEEMRAGETYRESTLEGVGYSKKETPKIFVRLDANGNILEFGRVDQKDKFSFYATEDKGVGVIIKPVDQKSLLKELGGRETGVAVAMVYGNSQYYTPKAQDFVNELERLSRHKEVVEFLEKKELPPFQDVKHY